MKIIVRHLSSLTIRTTYFAVLFFLVAESSNAQPSLDGNGEPGSNQSLEEIVVTASRRGVQLLQDVPVSITAFDQIRIEQRGFDDLIDYVRSVPGLGYNLKSAAGGRDDIRGGRRLNLRGIESGFDANPTTAFYLDETPVPIMDPKLFDIERVEVLRGPQGTLYGANSMGGTVRVVTNKPVMNELQLAADTTVSATHKGEESYMMNAMINVPVLEDRIATRGVVFYRDEGGYIDWVRSLSISPTGNSQDVTEDVNDERSWGARLLTDIQVTPALKVSPSIFHQQISIDGTGTYEPDFEDLAYHFGRTFLDEQEDEFTLWSLEADYSISENWNLLSSTSLFDSTFSSTEDLTKGQYNFYGDFRYRPPLYNMITSERFVQEIRLTYSSERWNGVLGTFYMDEDRALDQYAIYSESEDTSFAYYQTNSDEQVAVFGEATFNVTDDLHVTAGVRWFEDEQEQFVDFRFSEPGFSGGEVSTGDATGSSVSPKLQVSYDLDEEKMIYASVSKGFRPGGPTSLVPSIPECLAALGALGLSEPKSEFDPDTLWSYELGTKSSFFDRSLSIFAAAYYIDWTDVQQSVNLAASFDCGFSFTGNVGQAESKGFELELNAEPFAGWNLSGAVGYTDAEFAISSEEIGVVEGQDLPQVPKWTGSASLQRSFSTPTGHEAYIRGDFQYVGSTREGTFYGDMRSASYDTVNFRAGVFLNERTEIILFVDNAFDERAVLSFDEYLLFGGFVPERFGREETTTRPRTIGITVRFR